MIDLHCHSVFSDGTCSPEELVHLAEQAGLTVLSLTDHDTTEGLDRFLAAGCASSVETIAGIELSTEFGGTPLHILGYDFDPRNTELQAALTWVRDGRIDRNIRILEKLNKLGFSISEADVQQHSSDGVVGRPHIAAALLEKGYFKHRNKIFQQLLGKNKAAYVERRRLEPEQCVKLICAAGGVAVIAHPGQMKWTRNKLRRVIRQLLPDGLGGLEVFHPSHADHQVISFEQLCSEFDLAATGGSDFHGTFTPQLSLGTGFGSLHVPDHLLDGLYAKKH